MEYVQMTLNDWVEMKQELKRELMGVSRSFVRIGYTLRQIEDQKIYERDGYKTMAEFAKAELGLDSSTVSKLKRINREYSVDGYSKTLRPQYAEMGRSQLEEMLKLPEEDRKMVQPETSRQTIRDLKKFNKEEPETDVADDIRQVIENFFRDNEEILNAVFSEKELGTDDGVTKRLAEIINPAGNRSYRKGIYFLIMYEDKIAVKKACASPQEMTWAEFIKITMEIFGHAAAGGKTWQRYFGKEEEEPGEGADPVEKLEGQQALNGEEPEGQQTAVKEEAKRQQDSIKKESEEQREPSERTLEGQQAAQGNMGNPAECHGETEKKEIAPAQKKPENTEADTDFVEPEIQKKTEGVLDENSAEDDIPGQMEITKDMPEYCPQFMNEPEEPEKGKGIPEEIAPAQKKPENTEAEADFQRTEDPEGMDRPYGSRKAYLDMLSEYGAALYIAAHIKDMRNMTFTELISAGHWEKWLRTEVDDNGEEIDVVG